MLKFLVIGIALFLLYKLFMGDKKKKEMDKKKEFKEQVKTGSMVKDPVCGTFVSTEGTIRVREGEQLHHFCSYECRDKYLKQIEAIDTEAEEKAAKEEETEQ